VGRDGLGRGERGGERGGGRGALDLRRVQREDLPLALARLHGSLPVGARVSVRVDVRMLDVSPLLEAAGFEIAAITGGDRVEIVRLRTLPDIAGPGMRLLVCGLNPSLHSADAGVNFARPGNRFWPAARAAGIVVLDRDPWDALAHHHVGFTDLVKRSSVSATDLTTADYAAGAARLAWTVQLLHPDVVCFVGLTGWRGAVDKRATAGPQPAGFAGAAAYVMPNTSGLNAHATPADFAAHLRAAYDLGAPGE